MLLDVSVHLISANIKKHSAIEKIVPPTAPPNGQGERSCSSLRHKGVIATLGRGRTPLIYCSLVNGIRNNAKYLTSLIG
jgi:hypothetical protein